MIKILFLFLLGTIFGSFWSVLVFRLMRYQYASKLEKRKILKSIILGRSYCPNCGTKLKIFDLIPLVSYLLNKWKCRYCWKEISGLYLWLEIISGFIFVFVYILLSKFFVESIYFWIFYFWIVIFLWFFWLLVVWDILYYYLIEGLWILVFFWLVIWLFFNIGDFKVGFLWWIVFFLGFLFIYVFSKLYIRFRYKKYDVEWFWFWDVMVGFLIWLSLWYLYKIVQFDIENIVFYFLVYIILSSIVWILIALWLFVYSWFFNKQSRGNSIPFLPPMFVAYIIFMLFIVLGGNSL